MEYYLARTHWLDAMNPPTKEQIAILVNRVRSFIPDIEKIEFNKGTPAPTPQPSMAPNKRFRWQLLWIPGTLIVLLSLASWFVFGQKKYPETRPAQTPTPDFTAKINGRGATLIQGPGESYAAIGPVLADMKITGQAYDCSWLKVVTSTDGKSGWVNANQVTFTVACSDIPPAEIPAKPTLDFTAKISGFGASLFQGPGESYAVIGPVLADMKIVGQAHACSWLKVVTSDGKSGWLKANQVTFTVTCSDIPPAQ
jgi:uncharacterized protein YraI